MSERLHKAIYETIDGSHTKEEQKNLCDLGETIKIGEIIPNEIAQGEQVKKLIDDWIPYNQGKIEALKKLHSMGDDVADMIPLLEARRLLTFDEYERFISLNYDQVYLRGKPVSKAEYVGAKVTLKKPSKPAKIHYEDDYDYRNAIIDWENEISYIAKSQDGEDREREKKTQDYYRYIDEYNTREVPEYIRTDPAFICILRNMSFRDFIIHNKAGAEGYFRFISKLSKELKILRGWYEKQACYIPVSALKGHSYYIGSTGAGKTELLKVVVHKLMSSSHTGKCVEKLHGIRILTKKTAYILVVGMIWIGEM